jgi:hypothetical protein
MTSYTSFPVLICGYSREDEFCNVLGLAISSGSSRIYINIDGTDKLLISKSQEAMVSYINSCRAQFPNLEIIVRQSEVNLGAAVSVISSLDWFFSKEQFGLILEDDLEFDNSLYRFISWCGSRFEHDQDVWMISGSNFFSVNGELKGKIHFPSYPVTWGWATWRDKWKLMREEITNGVKPPSFFAFDPVSNFWQIGALRAKRGILDAWDIPLAEAMRRRKKMSVVPPENLVRNIGFSKLASNTRTQNYPLDLPIGELPHVNSLDNLLSESSLSGSNVDHLYETRVYGITFKHALTVLMSQLDFVRFKKYSNKSLKARLIEVKESNFRIL